MTPRMTQKSKPTIYDGQGRKIETAVLPVIKFREFTFAMELFDKNNVARPVDGKISLQSLIDEYRGRCAELDCRVQMLMALVCTMVQDGPEAGKEFLDSIGAHVTDLDNKVLYPKPITPKGVPS